MSPILGIYASQISGHLYALPSAYSSIQTLTVGAGGSSTITFSSIPSTYTHLQLRYVAKDARTTGIYASQLYLQYNSDSGTNYSQHDLAGNGTAISAYGAANATSNYAVIGDSTSGSYIGGGVIDILDYANTNKYKTMRALSGNDLNGSAGSIKLTSGSWRNTAAISTITITPLTSPFSQYSSFALYGVN
jgi:hypothetical protein